MRVTVSISAEERAKRQEEIREALASVRMEGLEPGPEATAIFQDYADGLLTSEEVDAAIEALHDRKYGSVRLSRNDRS